jgi:hypothetical protein
MTTTEKAYLTTDYNSQLYTQWRRKFAEFFPSERYFFENSRLENGISILDVGGAAGGLGTALLDSVDSNIRYTCIDPDKKAIEIGKRLDYRLNFIEGFFPEGVQDRYDMVIMLALFPQLPEWKSIIFKMKDRANKYINFSLMLRLSGPTVTDIDTAYSYYLDSGKRVHQIVHNAYEFFNFLSTSEIEAKKIHFYGYRVITGENDSFRPLPNSQIIRGNVLIEIELGRYEAGRTGAHRNNGVSESLGLKSIGDRPEIEFIFEGKTFRSFDEIGSIKL